MLTVSTLCVCMNHTRDNYGDSNHLARKAKIPSVEEKVLGISNAGRGGKERDRSTPCINRVRIACEEAKKRGSACVRKCVRACTSALGTAFLDRGPHRGLLFIFSLIEMECCRGQNPCRPPAVPRSRHRASLSPVRSDRRLDQFCPLSSARPGPNQSKPTSKCHVIVYVFSLGTRFVLLPIRRAATSAIGGDAGAIALGRPSDGRVARRNFFLATCAKFVSFLRFAVYSSFLSYNVVPYDNTIRTKTAVIIITGRFLRLSGNGKRFAVSFVSRATGSAFYPRSRARSLAVVKCVRAHPDRLRAIITPIRT